MSPTTTISTLESSRYAILPPLHAPAAAVAQLDGATRGRCRVTSALTRCMEPLVTVLTIWARADVSTAAIGPRQIVIGLGTHRFLDNEGESYGTTGASSTIGAIGSSTNGTTSSRTTEPLSSLPGVYGGSSCDHATSPPACSSPSSIFDRLV